MNSARPPSAIDRAFLTGVEAATELLLVRHGQQAFPDPATSTVGDWIDPPLSAIGERQAAAVGRHLASVPIDVVYSSQLQRAHRTGLAIAAHHGLEVQIDEDLREIETFRDLPRDANPNDLVGPLRMEGARTRFVRLRTWDVFPYSEPSDEFRHRTSNVIEGIVASHPGSRVVIACHGGVINAYIAEFLGLESAMFFRPAHASISVVRAHDQIRALETLNETHYLAAVDPSLVTLTPPATSPQDTSTAPTEESGIG